MAFASSLFTSATVPYLPSPRNGGTISFSPRFRPTQLGFPRDRLRIGFSTVASARRRSSEPSASKTKEKQQSPPKDIDEDSDEEMDDAAFEALCKELEKDLKDDPSFLNDDSEITEEEFAMVERALAQAMRGGGRADDIELSSSSVDDDPDAGEGDEEDDDAETVGGDKKKMGRRK